MKQSNKTQEALKMAIKAIKNIMDSLDEKQVWYSVELEQAIQACKEALAEAEKQEPVACSNKYGCKCDKHYTHPAPSWQGLDGIEILDMFTELFGVEGTNAYAYFDPRKFARAIEQALKEKNQ